MAKQNMAGTVRGSSRGRPIMVLFDVLGKRWTLRILWELTQGALSFRELQASCDQLSPTVLNNRLKTLREMALVTHRDGAGYELTDQGRELGEKLIDLHQWAERWARESRR